ncbi:MAG: ATP-dependent sacrificial sulfur transferase LarE [Candidatus Coatesbacteria bacterium]|nr:MAG: ATP-dependent sacrificial sulfur transferase LarE [Candidatus Coatesbacteria bacterium]
MKNPPPETKYDKLLRRLGEFPSLLVAFSGGADSTFLLAAAQKAVRGRVVAATARSPSYPVRELEHAEATARIMEAEHIFFDSHETENADFRANPPHRCYFCKLVLGRDLKRLAEKEGLADVAEGTTADELEGHRPGAKALRELDIQSPLAQVGLTKEEIRSLAREYGVPNFDRPPTACLASRFPPGEEITNEKLRTVEAAEQTLFDLGFRQIRCRYYGPVARIEVDPKEISRATIASIRKRIVDKFHQLGFRFVTLDLDGYRLGSVDESPGAKKAADDSPGA